MLYFNTKNDFFNYLSSRTEEALATLQMLLDYRFTWKVTAVLASKSEGKTDSTHMIQESDEDILQLELIEDSNAKLFRLGFTVKEAEDYINNLGNALVKYGEGV